MADDDVSALSGDRLVESLSELDPRQVGRAEFVGLLASVARLAAEGEDVDLARLDARSFARLVTRASADQVRGVLDEPELRVLIIDEIFRRMADHLRPDRAAPVDAIVHWRLTGGSGADGYDRYETVIEHGTCVVHREATREPRVTITVHPADFLRLVTRNASGPVLFLTGKVKVKGDLGFAAGLTTLFDLPTA